MSIEPQLSSQLMLAFAGALMGALFGGFARWRAVRRERQLRLTLELYSEFHSPPFNHLRILAHEALERGGKMPRAYEVSAGEAREAIATVVHFWEKVALLAREHALDNRLVRRFLGQYARWWRPLLCEAEGVSDPEWGRTLTDIAWLFDRISNPPQGEPRR